MKALKQIARLYFAGAFLFAAACEEPSDADDDKTAVDAYIDAYVAAVLHWQQCYEAAIDDEVRFRDLVEPEDDGNFVGQTEADLRTRLEADFDDAYQEYDASVLAECAQRFVDVKKQSCENILDGGVQGNELVYQLMICTNHIFTGTLEAGEACEEGQCADGVCGDDGDDCQCHAYAGVGEGCDATAQGCNPRDAYCANSESPTCVAYKELGDSCEHTQECRHTWGARCLDGKCAFPAGGAAPGAAGEVCALGGDQLCDDTLRCDGTTSTCVVGPQLGEACLASVTERLCDDNGVCFTWTYANPKQTCADGLYCGSDQVCAEPSQDGEACGVVDCADGLYCDWDSDTCRPEALLGDDCSDARCADGLYCDHASENGDDTCKAIPESKNVGDSCDHGEPHSCGEDEIDWHGLACIEDDVGDGTCVQAVVVDEGGVCNNSWKLMDGEVMEADKWCKNSFSTHYCKVDLDDDGKATSTTGVCSRKPGPGEPCAPEFECDESVAACAYEDAEGEWIDDEDRVCVALPGAGEACLYGNGPSCAEGLSCDWSAEVCLSEDEEDMCMDLTD